jgi:hypothetical protein
MPWLLLPGAGKVLLLLLLLNAMSVCLHSSVPLPSLLLKLPDDPMIIQGFAAAA